MDSRTVALAGGKVYSVLVPDVRTYLEEREKQLELEIANLRSKIAPLERELFEVKIAQRAVSRHSREPLQRQLFLHSAVEEDPEASEIWKQYMSIAAERANSPYARLTIKQLVLKALTEQFPSGATANQILDLFANAWGRGEIVRTSLSPQLSRLKAEHAIDREGTLWFRRSPRPEPDQQQTKAATDQ